MPQIGVRLPPPALDRIDALVNKRNAVAGWQEVNRSDIIRELVMSGLDRLVETEPAAAPKGGR